MQLVDDHAAEAGEELHGIGVAQQQAPAIPAWSSGRSGRPLALAQARTLACPPVRLSARTGKAISAIGISRLRRMSVASAFRGEM
jgi:hypothetical protein